MRYLFRTLGITALFFASVELAIRLSVPQIQPLSTDSRLVRDSVYGGFPGLRANTVGRSMNALFRVDKGGYWAYSQESASEKLGVLFLGDSVTMGIGVMPSKTFAGIIAQSLPDSLQLLNPSWLGYNHQAYHLVFEQIVKQRALKAVWVFWCWNDVIPLHQKASIRRASQNTLSHFLNNYYYTFQWIKNKVGNRPQAYYLHDAAYYKSSLPDYPSALESLKKIKTRCVERNISFNLVVLPYAYQLQEQDFSLVEKFRTDLALKGIKLIEVGFAAGELNTTDYLYGDGIHFAESGHHKIARWLQNFSPALYQTKP